MVRTTKTLPLIMLLALSGCATTQSDCAFSKQDLGFFTKLGCDAGGTNRAILDQQEQQLLTAQQQNTMFRMVYEDLAARSAATRKSLEDQRQAQAKLTASTNTLIRRLKQKYANNDKALAQLNNLQNELKELQNTPPATSATQIKEYEKRLAEKTQEFQQLQKILDQVS